MYGLLVAFDPEITALQLPAFGGGPLVLDKLDKPETVTCAPGATLVLLTETEVK